LQPLLTRNIHLDEGTSHPKNWLDCIKSRNLAVGDVANGDRSATVCHLGNIAIRTGRKVRWDPEREQILGDPEQAAMLNRPSRAPGKSPHGWRGSSCPACRWCGPHPPVPCTTAAYPLILLTADEFFERATVRACRFTTAGWE